MDGHIDITPENNVVPQTGLRIPLIPKRSSSVTPTKQIRRKSSFVRRVDSSEESPSPHGSIFEAYYHSTTNSDESAVVESWPMRTLTGHNQPAPSTQGRENDENSRVGATSATSSGVYDKQFLYGRGTVLETITEQNSHGSMRIFARAKSADELHSIPFLGHRDSFVVSKSPRRKKSLSLDDLNLVKGSYYQAVAMIERTTQKPLPIHEIYARPKTPVQEPPQRPPTPPGMPSWTEHQLRPPQRRSSITRGASNRLQRFFGIQPSRSRVPNPAPAGRPVSAPVGGQIPRTARYRPPKSVYGRIDQHPFNNASVAVVDPFPRESILSRPTGQRKSVRFTPSATARDSEMLALQTAVESTRNPPLPTVQVEPTSPIPNTRSRPSTPENRRQCPHRKGQHAALKCLNHTNTSTPGNEYQAILSNPLIRQSSLASLPNLFPPSPTHPSSSASSRRDDLNIDWGILDTTPMTGELSDFSATHLMTGALLAPSPSPTPLSPQPENGTLLPHSNENFQCWKCKLEAFRERIDKVWYRGGTGLCFICCGVEVEEDVRTPGLNNGNMRSGRYSEMMNGGQSTRRGWWGVADSPMRPARRVALESTRAAIG